MTDIELLNLHRDGSESAFADLVRRHLTWVYGLARRRLGDAHLAEDVAQAVFVLLHRKSPQFAADRAMTSWLYKTACYASDSAARAERRRKGRETKAAMSHPEATQLAETPEWQELAPMLDQLIGQLPRADREAILLRYYRDLSFADVAEQIGSTPDAARKRVERAIEKLRQMTAEKGSPISLASLTAGLATFVRIPPPPGLIATVTTVATAPAGSAIASSTAGIVKGALTMMSSAKITAVAVAAVALIAVTGSVCATIWVLSSSPSATVATSPAATSPAAAKLNLPQVQTLTITTDANGSPTSAQLPNGQQLFIVSNAQMRKLAPFSAIRWHGAVPEVQVKDTWYALIAINGLSVNRLMVDQPDPRRHRKHFAEDLVELMTRLGHAPGDAVDLQVQTLGPDKKLLTLQNVPLTQENRRAVMNWPATGQSSLFQDYRLRDSLPQVEENGTWYRLRAIEGAPIQKITEAGKAAYGPNWQNYNDMNNLTEILTSMGRKPQPETLLELQTLDTDETVELTVRLPEKN
jgi:RNA polymerase sigma factor (sigma-70 family)